MADVRLHLGDCLAVLPTLESGSVDCIVTDPPYNVGFEYADDSSRDRKDDYASWCASWFTHCHRVARSVAISCGHFNVGVWATMSPPPSWWLAWWKPAAMGRCAVGFSNWEPIAFWGKAWKQDCDVIRALIVPDRSLDGHPCPKPVEWAARQIAMMCPPGGTVLDPFMGSGTVGVACARSGRRFIGIEKVPDYFAIAERRIRDAQTGGPLFEPQPAPDLFAETPA